MPSLDVYLNDTPLSSFGAALETIEGYEDAPSQEDATVRVGGRGGLLVARTYADLAPRVLRVRGILTAASVTARQSAFNRIRQAVVAGIVEVRLAHEADRVFFARGSRCTIVPPSPQLVVPYARFEIEFTCYDPYRYGTSLTIISAPAATPTPVPLGTAPCLPTIVIYGAATNPTLTYRRADGSSVRTHAFTITLAAADSLWIDSSALTVIKSVSGTFSDAITTIASGDFIVLDPLDGDWYAGAWPTLETSQGTLGVQYRRAYL